MKKIIYFISIAFILTWCIPVKENNIVEQDKIKKIVVEIDAQKDIKTIGTIISNSWTENLEWKIFDNNNILESKNINKEIFVNKWKNSNVKDEWENICFNEKYKEKESFYKKYNFPIPKKLEYSLNLWKWKCPKYKNSSKIFIKTSNNNTYWKTMNWEFIIDWLILNNVEKIEVIWDWNMESYFLNKYIPWKSNFTYNISTKFWNIKVWTNKYLIRWYSKNFVFEKLFTLDYYDFSKNVVLKKIDKIVFNYDYNNWNSNIWYVKKDNIYNLWLNYWKYILNLEKNKIEFFNDIKRIYWEKNIKSYVKVISNWKEISLNGYTFITDDFSNPTLITYKNWDILFSMWWYEAPLDYVYYSNKFLKFIKIFDLINENVKKPNWYNNTKIEDNILIIKSETNPWSENRNNYELKFNLDTFKIIQ